MQFEGAIYNQQVLTALRNCDKHPQLSDDWANTHYIPVTAQNENDARRKLESKYPSRNGYVIECVMSA